MSYMQNVGEENMGRGFEKARDVVLGILQWACISIFGFAYWLIVLLIASLLLLNVWHVSFEWILDASSILAIITSLTYAVILIRRRLS